MEPMNNFTPRAQQVLALARKEADRFHHNYVGTEHILLGLIKLGQGVAVSVLQKMGLDLGTGQDPPGWDSIVTGQAARGSTNDNDPPAQHLFGNLSGKDRRRRDAGDLAGAHTERNEQYIAVRILCGTRYEPLMGPFHEMPNGALIAFDRERR